MSSIPNHPEIRGDSDLSDVLAAELRATYRRDISVPPSLDAAILREAKAGFARRRRFRLVWRGAAAVAAAAAVIVLAIQLRHSASSSSPVANVVPGPQQSPLARGEDIDGNGKVNILDAFVVAKL